MHVNFYATLRAAAGAKTIDAPVSPPATALAILQEVSRSCPALADEIWASPGVLKEHIRVFINGRQSIFLPQGLETLVNAEDSIDVFPPIGGGSCSL